MDFIILRLTMLVGVFVSFFIALSLNNKLQEQGKFKPFKWGYYQAGMSLFTAAGFAIDFLAYLSSWYAESLEYLVAFLIVSAYGSGAFLLFKRKRSGAVITTILSLNPIVWIINDQYYKKRWSELSQPEDVEQPDTNSQIVDSSIPVEAIKANESPDEIDIQESEKHDVVNTMRSNLNPPDSCIGRWSNERYTVVLLKDNIEILEHGSGSMKFPKSVEELYENNGYALSYKDPYTLAHTSYRFMPIDGENLTFILDRDGYNIEIKENLKRSGRS